MFQTSHDAQYAIRQLPFVDIDNEAVGHPLDFWSVVSSGNSEADIAMGEHYAAVALDVARQFDMPVLIAMALRDMALAGRVTGIEAGFIAAVASAARVGSHH
jgi:hypothetical protein